MPFEWIKEEEKEVFLHRFVHDILHTINDKEENLTEVDVKTFTTIKIDKKMLFFMFLNC